MINLLVMDLILIVLTIAQLAVSSFPIALLFAVGILTVLLTAGEMTDGHKKLLYPLQFFVAVLFASFSGHWFGWLALACFPWTKLWQKMFCGSVGIIVSETIWNGMEEIESGEAGHFIALLIVKISLFCILTLLINIPSVLIHYEEKRREQQTGRMMEVGLGQMHEMIKNRELARQSFYAEKNARLVERENISRNIHNSVGHSITAAIMTLDAADMLFDKKPEEAHTRMNDANKRIRGSLESIRSAVRALDEESKDLSVKDLLCYVNNILDEFLMDTRLTCDRVYDFYSDNVEIPKEHAEFLTGALEECLTNGVKHGNATHYTVELSGDSAHIRLMVKDNGQSDFDDANKDTLIRNGFGLKKLDAYVKHCGGKTQYSNENGFRTIIELPFVRSMREEL